MDITIRNLQTKVTIRIPRIDQVARRALKHIGFSEEALSIVFVTPARMKTLNSKYLKHAYVTDILTFDYHQGPKASAAVNAEIVICPSVAVANAKTFGAAPQDELELYVIHGILHLAGYDDHSPRQTARMRKKERELIGIINSK
jgi:probable rRNA maturation factor